jgi:hypothetical protein
MAESQTKRYMMAITLTYNNETEFTRDGATVFRYKDVMLFMKNLRRQIQYKTGTTGAVRFLCAGETGSKKGRVHWHLILFTDYDLTDLGKWRDRKSGHLITEKEEKFDMRLNWTLWKNGFVYLQQSDQGGVAYILKYILKDQYNIVNAKGTMRETTAENYSASYFRMSKQPPIGGEWLAAKLKTLNDKMAVPTSLQLKIPNYTGYWYPKGVLREYLLDEVYRINQEVIAETGRPAPQMNALLHSVVSQEKELERLQYGKEKDEDEELTDGTFERKLDVSARQYAQTYDERGIRTRCGGQSPCEACLRGFTDFENQRFKEWSLAWQETRKREGEASSGEFKEKRTPNPFCVLKNAGNVRRAFSRLT